MNHLNKPKISLIAAIGSNRELGKDNKLLWDIPEDMKYFREITSGHAVVMGRKTFESIGRLLPNRANIIITRDLQFKVEGAVIAHSLNEALEKAKEVEKEEIFVIGGGNVYEQAIGMADKLYLTVVEGNFEADTYFPDYSQFTKVVQRKESNDSNYRYTFLELVK